MKKLLLALTSTFLALLAAEAIVRLAGLAPDFFVVERGRYRLVDNPRLLYEPVPHYVAAGAGPLLDFQGRANSLGFRDREHPVAKPQGVWRILVLGDSITQGMGIQDPQAVFTAVMERRLREAGYSVEVLNFGVNGYNTLQEAELLRERGLAFSPDLVVLQYCFNDTYYDSGGIYAELLREREGRPQVALPRALLASALFRLAYAATTLPRASELAPPPLGPAVIQQGVVAEGLGLIARMAAEAGFPVLIALFPLFQPGASGNQFAEVQVLADRHGLMTLDLTPCDFEPAFPGDWIHPDAAGHACAGDLLAAFISERFGVGASPR